MTNSQYQTLMTVFHRLEAKVDRIEARQAFLWPTEREALAQLEAEVDDILACGGVRVFAD